MTPVLQARRSTGLESFDVDRARWGSDKADGLWFEVTTHQASGVSPHWSIENLAYSELPEGWRLDVPEGYDNARGEYLTNLYCWEHETTEANTIEVLAVDGDRRFLRLTGQVVDWDDRSDPAVALLLEAWFERVPMAGDDLAAIVAEEVAKAPAPKQFGHIMKAVMASVDDRAEGAVVADAVRNALNARFG